MNYDAVQSSTTPVTFCSSFRQDRLYFFFSVAWSGAWPDPNIIWYHLTSLPGAGERESLLLLRRRRPFLRNMVGKSWSVFIVVFHVNGFFAL